MGSSEIYYDPFDHELHAEPHAVWRSMREEAPLYRNDRFDFWALSRWADVLTALGDPQTYSSAYGTVLDMMSDQPFGGMMIFTDPPEHTRLRSVVTKAFGPRRMAQLEERVVQICCDYLDPFVGSAGFDYVGQFGSLLAARVVGSLIGFPPGHEEAVRDMMEAMMQRTSEGTYDASKAYTGPKVFELLPDMIRQRRETPTDDLLSTLVNADVETDDGEGTRRLTDPELFSYVPLLVGAGAETTARLLGWAAVILARHPDQRAALAADPKLVPNAVEELLRFESPSPVQARRVLRPVELYGVTVPAGANMLLLNGSANRDERVFRDPDRFDIRRPIERHLAFGYGIHFCVGSVLARMEARVALTETLKRFPSWTIDEAELERVHTSSVRGFRRVPIHFP